MDNFPSLSFCNILCSYVCQHPTCQIVVRLENIKQHLQRKHHISSKKAREHAETLVRAADGKYPHEIASRYFRDPYPKEGEQPLPVLHSLPIYDVMKCPFCEQYFRGVSSCRNHVNAKHRNREDLASAIEKLKGTSFVKGQALFLGSARLLFPVTMVAGNHMRGDSSHLSIICREEPQQCITESDELSIREKSSNLICTILDVPNFLDQQKLTIQKAYELSRIDVSYNQEVTALMLNYIQHFASLQPAIPLSIIEGIKIRNADRVASFSLHIEMRSKKRYAAVAARVLGVVSRMRSYNLAYCPIKTDLLAIGEEIVLSLSRKQSTPLHHVHQFFRRLLLEQVRASDGESVSLEGIFKLLMAGYACGVRTKRVRVGDSEDASHTAAALQYFCHMAALGEFLKEPKGFGERINENEQIRFNRIRGLLSTESCTPAAYIRDVLRKTKQLSAGESPKIHFVICPKHPLCGAVDNIEVPLNSDTPGSIGYTVRKLSMEVRLMLHKELMRGYNTPPAFLETILSFPDKLNEKEAGYYFGEGARAKEVFRLWSEDFSRHLIGGERPILQSSGSTDTHEWRPTSHASDWLRAVDNISALLYILVHMCGGGPPRVTEMVDAKLKNVAGSRRNVYIVKHCLAIIGSYSKTARQFTTPKPIARFLDPGTSELILKFVVFIKPVQCYVLRKSMSSVRATEDYLFCQSGEKMEDAVIHRLFAPTLASKGLPLNISLYRQYRAGAAKAFLTTDSTPDIDEELVFQQAGHTEATARTRYAGGDFNVGGFSLAKLEGFFKVSVQWHSVIGINKAGENSSDGTSERKSFNIEKEPDKKKQGEKRPIESGLIESERVAQKRGQQFQGGSLDSKRRNVAVAVRPVTDPTSIRVASLSQSILAAMARVLGKAPSEKVHFNSDAQRAALFECAMQTILMDYGSSMIVVLPTGGGKTLCWAAPARREQDIADEVSLRTPITVLVLPLISLQQDMARKSRKYGIRCGLWSERFREDITVVVCSIDVVFTNEYARYITALSVRGRVARIVLDECHLILLWESFRKFGAIGRRLRTSEARGIPIVCLTATLPSPMIETLGAMLHLDTSCMKLYRAISNRPNISYAVQNVPFQTSESMIEYCTTLAIDELRGMNQAERMIVFCLTVNDCISLHRRISSKLSDDMVCIYHGSMSHKEREKNFNSWISEIPTKPIAMIATSAFGCGIDYPHVRMVLHAGGARSIVELAQESGRAGRDGNASRNLVVFNEQYMKDRTERGGAGQSQKEKDRNVAFGDIRPYLRGCCRRETMESFLNCASRGPCTSEEIKCDVCSYFESSGWKEVCTADLRNEAETQISDITKTPLMNQAVPRRKRISNDIGGLVRSGAHEQLKRGDNLGCMVGESVISVAKWKAKQIALLKCAVCLFQGIKGCDGRNSTSCMRGMCFRCLERNATHQSRDCNVTPRTTGTCKRCFFCGISDNSDLHSRATFNKGDKCEWLVAKNLALLAFRSVEHRRELLNRIPKLRRAHSMKDVGLQLCGADEKHAEVLLAQAVDYMYSTFVLRDNVAMK